MVVSHCERRTMWKCTSILISLSCALYQSDPMEVVAQAGEFEVIFSIMKTSLPILAGWAPLIDYAVQASIKDAASGGYGGSGGNGGGNSGGGGRFGGGGIASGGVPF